MHKLIRLTYMSLVVLLPLIFTPVTSELFEFPKFLLLLTASIIVAVNWLVYVYQTKDKAIPLGRHKIISYGMIAILLSQALATLFSIHPYTSFWGYYSRFHQGLLTTICYTILYFGAVKFLDLKDAGKLLKLSLYTAVFIAILAILEHYNFSITCPIINSATGGTIAFDNSCWKNLTNPTYRSFASLGQPNWLAAYLIPNVFILLYQFFSSKKKILTTYTLYAICYTLLIGAISLTKSRSGLLAVILSLFGYAYLLYRLKGKTVVKQLAIILLIPLAFAAYSYIPNLAGTVPTANTAITTSDTPQESTASSDIRKIVWTGALKLFMQKPILGYGPETFAYTYYQVRPESHNYTTEWDYLYNKAHNEYLNFLATAGLVGLLAYLYFHYALVKVSFTKLTKSKKVAQDDYLFFHSLYPTLSAVIISFAVTNFFGFSVIPVYLITILFASIINLAPAHSTPDLTPTNHIISTLVTLTLIGYLPLRLYLSDYNYNLAKNLHSVGQYEQALPFMQKSVSYRPGEALYHSYLGEIYAGLGQVDQALGQAELTKQLNPYHLNFYKSRAKIYITLATSNPDYYQHAATELEQARTLAPTDPKLAYNLGLIYSRLGDADKSIEQMQDALSMKKDYYEPYYALTLLYESTKKQSEIPALLEQAKSNLKTIPEPLQTKLDKYLIL